MNSFNHASSEFLWRTSLKADDKAVAKASLALAGIKRNVG
jgi:hypothetical protein